eukprot:s2168_g2.t1
MTQQYHEHLLEAGEKPSSSDSSWPWRWILRALAFLMALALALAFLNDGKVAPGPLKYLYISFHGDGSATTPLPQYGVNTIFRFDLENLGDPASVLGKGSPTPPRMLRDMLVLNDGTLFVAQGLKFDSAILQYGPCDQDGVRPFQREYRSPILVHPYALTLLGDTLFASTQDSGTVVGFNLTESRDLLSSGDRINFNLKGDFRYRPGITYRGIANYKRCLYLSVTEMDVVGVICDFDRVSRRIPVRHPIGIRSQQRRIFEGSDPEPSRCSREHRAVSMLNFDGLDRALRGWALHQTYGHRVVNVSQCGANTASTKERLKDAVTQLKPDIVIIALSLGNEGLAHCPAAERRAAQHRFEQGLLDLISMVLAMDAMPILGGVYPNNDYNAETYAMLKETARTMATWNVPIFEWLPALDDGHGRWKESLYFDHAHPNTEGQRHMFECIDLSLFAHTGEDIPQLVRRRSSLTQLDSSERQTSYSHLDEAVQASQAAESTAHGEAIGPPAFEDGRGFSIVLCRGAISIRNKTEDEYVVSAEWQALSRALVAAGLRPGIYVSRDECCQNNRVLFVNHEGLMTKRLILPPSADALYLPSFQQGSGQDR